MIIYEEKPEIKTQIIPEDVIIANMKHLSEFETGVNFVINKLRNKLYYVPDAWKEGNTLALYNIIDHTLNDIEIMFLRDDPEEV